MDYLVWNLDMEEGADLYDPIGNIKILGDKGSIEELYTYIDAFFEAIIEGIEHVDIESVVVVDPLIEPNNIVFSYKDSILEIEYGSQKTSIFDKPKFAKEIQKATRTLVKLLDEFADNTNQQKRELIRLRNFLTKEA